MKPPRKTENELILGLVSVSDRASRGVYRDEGIPALEAWMRKAVKNPLTIHKRLIPDERFDIEKTLRELVDIIGCDLILTTGGTGPSRRDVTPEATLAVATLEMPGFGEQMRAISGLMVAEKSKVFRSLGTSARIALMLSVNPIFSISSASSITML